MIFTLYLLLILALIILKSQKNLTIFSQQLTEHSTTIHRFIASVLGLLF